MGTIEKPIVLVVDDEKDQRELLKDYFTDQGYQVDLASTIKGAMKEVHGSQELMGAIIDWNMREGTAQELLHLIKSSAPHRVLAYVLTGDARRKTYLAARRAGAFRVFIKTVDQMEDIQKDMESDIELFRGYGEDDMTGLNNFRTFRKIVLAEMKTAHSHPDIKHPEVFSLVFVDLDDLGVLNDEHGHLVGDEALKKVGRVLQHHVRASDKLCRKGGDEFFMWVPDIDEEEMAKRLADIKAAAAAESVVGKSGFKLPLSISVGVSRIRRAEIGVHVETVLEELIRQANKDEQKDKAAKEFRKKEAS